MSSLGPDLKRFPSKPSKATAGGSGGGGGKSTAATVSKSSNPFDDDDDENKDQGRHPPLSQNIAYSCFMTNFSYCCHRCRPATPQI
jgi:hypothetical protein